MMNRWNVRTLRHHFRRGTPVYLPVNPVEYHGPHLSLLNDHLVSRGLAEDMHQMLQARLGDHPLLFARDLGVGVDPCPGPGSEFTPYRAVRERVLEASSRLADLGATRVVFITFHGSPMHAHAIQAGVRALTRRGISALAPLSLAVRQQMRGELEDVEDAWMAVGDISARAALKAELRSDFHAGFIETSVALHYVPEQVEAHRALPPCPPPVAARAPATLAALARTLGWKELSMELELVALGLGWYSMRPFPGYSGRPDLASADSGAVFARAMVRAFSETALRVFEDGAPPPTPPLGWMPWVTAGGRIGGVKVPADSVVPIPEASP